MIYWLKNISTLLEKKILKMPMILFQNLISDQDLFLIQNINEHNLKDGFSSALFHPSIICRAHFFINAVS
jgi:hypothetical protein